MSDIIIDAGIKLGDIKPVHSICNSPKPLQVPYWKQVQFPYTRLHDSLIEYHLCVDIGVVFPNFDADENDPASYDFSYTDVYIRRLLDLGVKIIYRLGSSADNGPFRYGFIPPKDYAKWARICNHIISHYNDGWANGMNAEILYWEIWNEPDPSVNETEYHGFWGGPPITYYEFYCTVTPIIKKAHPEVLIGGYASCAISQHDHKPFCAGFFEYLAHHDHVLDFFSYHLYGDSIDKLDKRVQYVTEMLDKYSYHGLPQIITEYEYLWEKDGIWDDMGSTDPARMQIIAQMESDMRSSAAAAYAAAAMIRFLDTDVLIANYYQTDNPGLFQSTFSVSGLPYKPYYAHLAFSKLYQARTRVKTTVSPDGIYCAAAGDENGLQILVSQYTGLNLDYTIQLNGFSKEFTAEVFLLDQNHDLESVSRSHYTDGTISLYLRAGSFVLISVKKD